MRRLNRVRIHLQVLFLLDVLTTLGCRIDSAATRRRPPTSRMSTLNWPKEEPTAEDMALWKDALEDICPSRRHLNCLGHFVSKSHWIREWQWCGGTNELLRYPLERTEMTIYLNTTRKFNQYTEAAAVQRITQGEMCSVDEVQPGVFRVTSIAQEGREVPVLETFMEVLREWGCSWLWEHMSIKGGTSWVA